MRSNTDIVVGLITIGLSLVGLYSVYSFEPLGIDADPLGAIAFPKAIAYLTVLAGVALTIKAFRETRKLNYWPTIAIQKKIAKFLLLFTAYIFMVLVFNKLFVASNIGIFQVNMGFFTGSAIFLAIATYMLGRRNKLEIILIAICIPGAIVLSFGTMFRIILP